MIIIKATITDMVKLNVTETDIAFYINTNCTENTIKDLTPSNRSAREKRQFTCSQHRQYWNKKSFFYIKKRKEKTHNYK